MINEMFTSVVLKNLAVNNLTRAWDIKLAVWPLSILNYCCSSIGCCCSGITHSQRLETLRNCCSLGVCRDLDSP